MSKKEEEKQLLRHFGLVYKDYPKGRVLEGESPDFILKPNRKHTIGIELTKLLPTQLIDKSLHHYYNEVLEEVQNILNIKKQFPFSATFRFSDAIDLNDDETYHNIVETLIEAIQRRLIDKNSGYSFHLKINKQHLPKGINSAEIIHHPTDKIHRWLVPKGRFTPTDLVEKINVLLKKKERKLENYQQKVLNEYWLLITVEDLKSMTNFNITNLLERSHFESSFDNVFLFDYFGRKVYELI